MGVCRELLPVAGEVLLSTVGRSIDVATRTLHQPTVRSSAIELATAAVRFDVGVDREIRVSNEVAAKAG